VGNGEGGIGIDKMVGNGEGRVKNGEGVWEWRRKTGKRKAG
jgi:hypothetical protein